MKLIAHRGLVTKDIKENTIDAFKSAIDSSKYVGFELDIRETKDKVFVVYHDVLFKGKLIKNINYEELKKENIPRLIDVLKLKTDKIIMIEIKDFNINLKRLAKLLNKFNYQNLYVSSFNNEVLLELKKIINNIKIGSLNYILNSMESYKCFDFICIINYLITPEIINYFKTNNLEVFTYGVFNKESIIYQNVYYIIDDIKLR